MISIFTILEQRLSEFNENEFKIAKYILDNKSLIPNYSIKELAAQADVSISSISRFAKKIGFQDFKLLKLEIAKDSVKDGTFSSAQLSSHEIGKTPLSATQVINHVLTTTEQSILSLTNTLNSLELEHAASRLIESNKILIFGIDGSYPTVLDLYNKLARIGFSIFESNDIHLVLGILSKMNQHDTLILISISGKTRELVKVSKFAAEKGIKIIVITSHDVTSPLYKIADYKLCSPILENSIRIATLSSRLTQLTIVDCLFIATFNSLTQKQELTYDEGNYWLENHQTDIK